MAYGVFLETSIEPGLLRLLHWKTDFFTTGPPGKPVTQFEPFPISGLRTRRGTRRVFSFPAGRQARV